MHQSKIAAASPMVNELTPYVVNKCHPSLYACMMGDPKTVTYSMSVYVSSIDGQIQGAVSI